MALTVQPVKRSLVSPVWDFWLLGGFSIAVWLVMSLGSTQRTMYGVSNHFASVAMTMAVMSIFVNYPHFLASYKLAYTRGSAFLRRHWFQTLAVPCLLIDLLIYCYYQINEPGQKDQGIWMLGILINFMFFTVGWHYTKQAFGCMMVYAAYDRYPLERSQRELIRWSLLSIWWYNWTQSNFQPRGVFWGLNYAMLPWAGRLFRWSWWLFVLLALAALGWVVVRNWRRGYRPSATFLIPYLAMMVWFAPCFRQPDFYMYVVPFFHSLQYLAFVYRIEHRAEESPSRPIKLVAGLLISGWLAFEFVPGNLDAIYDNTRTFGFSYFLIAANLFLNIHHYFLDNVLWRVREDKVVQEALFPSQGPATQGSVARSE